MQPTVFDSRGNERLIEWKKFRDSLELSDDPFNDVAKFWSRAPFVSAFLDPHNSSNWPDPWHLILDDRYDELAIVLGMLYTIKLTQRFTGIDYEIYMSTTPPNEKDKKYFLIVNDKVLNFEYRTVMDKSHVELDKSSMIWSKNNNT